MRYFIFFLFFFNFQTSTGASLALILEIEEKMRQVSMPSLAAVERNKTLNDLDHLALLKIDYIASQLKSEIDHLLQVDRENKNLKLKYEEAIFFFDDYVFYRNLFGEPKDHLRTEAFRKFVDKSLALLQSEWAKKKTTPRKWFQSIAGVKALLSQTLPISRFASSSFRRSHEGLSRALEIVDDFSPVVFTSGINYVGLEHLANLDSSAEKSIVVINHSFPALDGFVWAHIMSKLPGTPGIVGMAQGWKNDLMAKVVIENQGIVIVGERDGVKYNNTVDRVVDALEAGVDHLFVFPEGSSGAGVGEIKPIAPGFSSRLVPQVIQRFKVNLITVTTIDTYAKLGHWDNTKTAEVTISKPLDHESIKTFVDRDPDLLDAEIRAEWVTQISTRKNRILGQFSISDLLTSIYGEDVLCRKLFEESLRDWD